MSRNISKLSGRKGLKDNLFKRMIDTTKKTKNGKEIKQLAEEYHVGMSTIHGAESFYEFLRPEHKEKKHGYVMVVHACAQEHKVKLEKNYQKN